MKKYVLTGAPSCGKTAVILALERVGYPVVRETAEDTIRMYQARGIETPWEQPKFQHDIYQLQVQRENMICKEKERVFLDRGFPDILAYTDVDKQTELWDRICDDANRFRYDGVYYLEMLPRLTRSITRRERDTIRAQEMGLKTYYMYQDLGYKPRVIPVRSIEERVERILADVELEESR